jgi:hypothetical protein
MHMRTTLLALLILSVAGPAWAQFLSDGQVPNAWTREWPHTDFSQAGVPLDEIMSGGPPKDGIPSIDDPQFVPVAEAAGLAPSEPVIGFAHDGDARAYPLRILTWHEIVNDRVGGRPVAVTYCPLCNAAIVFDRTLPDGTVTEFGTTGKLRKSDLVMYDRTTESWWQQFSGQAIVGDLTGARLEMLPARLESFESFAERHPGGRVLVPNDPDFRDYGRNPYVGYDGAARPFLYRGALPEDVPAMAYVVAVGDRAWTLETLRAAGRIETDDGLVLTWRPGKSSALDSARISKGRDIGNVVVQRRAPDATLEDAVYDLTFAFVFHAFRPEGEILR